MDLKYVALGAMKPRENDEGIAYRYAIHGRGEGFYDVYPSVGCAFVPLTRGCLKSGE